MSKSENIISSKTHKLVLEQRPDGYSGTKIIIFGKVYGFKYIKLTRSERIKRTLKLPFIHFKNWIAENYIIFSIVLILSMDIVLFITCLLGSSSIIEALVMFLLYIAIQLVFTAIYSLLLSNTSEER